MQFYDIDDCRWQTYDSAANMPGSRSRELQPEYLQRIPAPCTLDKTLFKIDKTLFNYLK